MSYTVRFQLSPESSTKVNVLLRYFFREIQLQNARIILQKPTILT